MKLFSVLLVAVSAFAVSCERHDFEGPDGTKQLHLQHHGAGHDDSEHASSHGEHNEGDSHEGHDAHEKAEH